MKRKGCKCSTLTGSNEKGEPNNHLYQQLTTMFTSVT